MAGSGCLINMKRYSNTAVNLYDVIAVVANPPQMILVGNLKLDIGMEDALSMLDSIHSLSMESAETIPSISATENVAMASPVSA